MPSAVAAPPPPPTPTSLAEADRLLARAAAAKGAWAHLAIDARIALLRALRERTVEAAPAWVEACLEAKHIAPHAPEAAEEWFGGPLPTVRNLRLLEESLTDVRDHGALWIRPGATSQRPDGRLVVQVFPANAYDTVMFGGFRAEVWMRPGVTADHLARHQAHAYREPPGDGEVGLVLGAGNMASIPIMDALYQLFAERRVVVLKLSEVNAYLAPIFRRIFGDLVDSGFFSVVTGGADLGAHLTRHPVIDAIHVTGSDRTHDAIVWGPAEGRAERKARGERALDKPITSELGNVTPVIVVPGEWSEREIRFQAENVATMVANNAAFNCSSARVLVTSADWPQREAFLATVKEVLAGLPSRPAWFPGAEARWEQVGRDHPEAELLSPPAPGTVPFTFVGDLDPTGEGHAAFREETFCSVLFEVALPGRTAIDFLQAAVEHCNEKLWGTLACVLLVHPRTRRDSATEAAFQEALDDLRYGTIGVNHWAGVAYAVVTTPWGAYPGHTLDDIQSGRGVVHNALLFDASEKSVLYGPFTMFPKPVWFVTHRNGRQVAERLVRFEGSPSVAKLPGIALAALRG